MRSVTSLVHTKVRVVVVAPQVHIVKLWGTCQVERPLWLLIVRRLIILTRGRDSAVLFMNFFDWAPGIRFLLEPFEASFHAQLVLLFFELSLHLGKIVIFFSHFLVFYQLNMSVRGGWLPHWGAPKSCLFSLRDSLWISHGWNCFVHLLPTRVVKARQNSVSDLPWTLRLALGLTCPTSPKSCRVQQSYSLCCSYCASDASLCSFLIWLLSSLR